MLRPAEFSLYRTSAIHACLHLNQLEEFQLHPAQSGKADQLLSLGFRLSQGAKRKLRSGNISLGMVLHAHRRHLRCALGLARSKQKIPNLGGLPESTNHRFGETEVDGMATHHQNVDKLLQLDRW